MKLKLSLSLSAAILALLAAPLLQAKKVEFPVGDPVFTFTMPDDWTTETGKDGRLYCTAPDGFKIGLIASPGVSNAEGAKKMLSTVIKGMSDAMKCENYKADEIKAGEMGKLWVASLQAQCKSEGIEMALNALVFSFEAGNYFSIVGAAPAIVGKAHDKEMNELIRSITAVD